MGGGARRCDAGAEPCLGVVRGGSYDTDLATELRTWVRREVPATLDGGDDRIPLRIRREHAVDSSSPMTCAVLSIGTELTRGELVNSNAAWLSAALTDLGFEVVEHAVVDDDRPRIIEALERLAAYAQVIVCTGGLGPTTDDLTTASVAAALGVGLVRDEGSLDHIRRRFERLGRPMSDIEREAGRFSRGRDDPRRTPSAPRPASR